MQKRQNSSARKGRKAENKGAGIKKFGIHLGVMAIIAILLLALSMFGLSSYTHHGEELEVPELKGLTADAATQKLESMGLEAEISDSVFIKNQRPDIIYAQSLPAGTKVKVGRLIHLTINTSQPPMITLPDIADNSSVREATIKLTSLGLQLASNEYISGEKDWVYGVKINGKNVSAGQRIPSYSKITLVVGNGTFDSEDIMDSTDIFAPDDESLTGGATGIETDPL